MIRRSVPELIIGETSTPDQAGAIYFGRMGDRIGRKKVRFITIALMGASTTLIGVLPTYQMIASGPRSCSSRCGCCRASARARRSPGPRRCRPSTPRPALSALTIVAAFPLMWMITSGSVPALELGMVIALNIGGLGLFSLESVTMAELFGSRTRFTQLALAKEVGPSSPPRSGRSSPRR